MNNRTLEFSVGLFVIIGLAALAMLTFKIGNFSTGSEQQSYNVSASFSNIGGLSDKSPVRMAGVTIGRVSKITIDPQDYSAIVHMKISQSYNNLPADSSAAILTSGLVGSNYVGIEAGGDFDYLVEGDRIEITQSAVVLERLIGQFLFNSSSSKSNGVSE